MTSSTSPVPPKEIERLLTDYAVAAQDGPFGLSQSLRFKIVELFASYPNSVASLLQRTAPRDPTHPRNLVHPPSHPAESLLSPTDIKRLRAKRKKRTAGEFKRIYGSKKRVEWVKSLPCAHCGVVGYSDNAHYDSDGMGRKSHYTHILPLCHTRNFVSESGVEVNVLGCHTSLHLHGRKTLERFGRIDLKLCAMKTELDWQAFSKEGE